MKNKQMYEEQVYSMFNICIIIKRHCWQGYGRQIVINIALLTTKFSFYAFFHKWSNSFRFSKQPKNITDKLRVADFKTDYMSRYLNWSTPELISRNY